MNHQLYIVEGLPCSGKSGTSKYIADILKSNGFHTQYYDEGDINHPADYEFHSYLTTEELNKLDKEEINTIKEISVRKLDGYIVPLHEVKGDLFDKVIQYKIYDHLPWDIEKKVMLDRWSEFVASIINKDEKYVLNCCFLQNSLCETMMRFNFPYEVIKDYIQEIYNRIKSLNPVIIYLKTSDIKERIEEVSKEREMEWLHSVIDYHTSWGYGKENDLVGFDGYIACLSKRQEVELRILNELPLQKIIIDNPYDNWDDVHALLKQYIIEL